MNIQNEFNSFLQFVLNIWSFQDKELFLKLSKISFDKGVHNAQLFCDQGITYQVEDIITKKNPTLSIDQRQKSKFPDGLPAFVYDAFSFFDYNFQKKIDQFSEEQFKIFSYDKEVNILIKELISQFPILKNFKPTSISNIDTKKLVKAYSNFQADNIYYMNTVNRICPENIIYSKEEQGHSFLYLFISIFYAHGAACQQELNTQQIINLLIPFYIKFISLPLNKDNHFDVLNDYPQHPILDILKDEKLTYKIPN